MSAAKQLRISPVSLRNVAFAMDFSPGSLLAFPFAVDIAARCGGTVFVIHIVPNEDYNAIPLSWQSSACRVVAAMEESLISPLGSLREIPHELFLDHGGIGSGILAAADRCNSDLLVIGTHGRQGLKKLLKGSIAEEVAYQSSRPILMVGPNVTRRSRFRHILCVTDYSADGMRTLPYALSLAEIYDASLALLHVKDCTKGLPSDQVPDYGLYIRNLSDYGYAESPEITVFRKQLRRFGYGGVADTAELIVKYSLDVNTPILRCAEDRDVDLIVVRLPRKESIMAKIAAHLPGMGVYDVVSRAYCPILTVPG